MEFLYRYFYYFVNRQYLKKICISFIVMNLCILFMACLANYHKNDVDKVCINDSCVEIKKAPH